MRPGAHTPEELETLLEDAFVTRDRRAVAALFEDGALLAGRGLGEVRGRARIVDLAERLWNARRTYLADPFRVLQARGTALVITPGGVSVVRRGPDGAWRYAIAFLTLDHPATTEEET